MSLLLFNSLKCLAINTTCTTTGKVLAHLGSESKVLLSGWYSATQTHSRVSNVNFDIGRGGGRLHYYFMSNSQQQSYRPLVFNRRFTDLGAWVGFCISSPQQGINGDHSQFFLSLLFHKWLSERFNLF